MVNDNLDENVKEILTYVEREDFNIFYADPEKSAVDNSGYFVWDKSKDWKDFFKVAKKEGVSTIVITITILEKDFLQELKGALEDERQNSQEITNKDGLNALTDTLDQLSKYTGKTGFYSFVWLKDGIEYSLTDSADWYDNMKAVKDILLEGAEAEVDDTTSGLTSSISITRPVPPFLKDKTEDELVKDMIEFILEESKGVENIGNYHFLTSVFWSKNGIDRFRMPEEATYLTQKVNMKALQQIKAMRIEKEKEEVPKLVEECYNWCKENNLSRMTKTRVSAFLVEKGISLSSHGKDLLYQKVDMKLRSS